MTDTTSLPPLPLPPAIKQSYLRTHNLNYHLLSAGSPSDPLILCLHGFPELAYSYRKILLPIAEEGYHVVAYDQRGYGRTTGWDTRPYEEVDLNTFRFTNIVRDAVVLVSALGYKEVECVIGNDFGGLGAGLCAMMRPDIFKSVFVMTHPFKGPPTIPPPSPIEDIQTTLTLLPFPRKHYKWYYSSPSAAHDLLHPISSLPDFFRAYFHLKSHDWTQNNPHTLTSWSAAELAKLPYYYVMPLHTTMREAVQLSLSTSSSSSSSEIPSIPWLTNEELHIYIQEYTRTGFQGGLNWYRIATSPSHLSELELFSGTKIDVPCIFVSGVRDWGAFQDPGTLEKIGEVCTRFKGVEMVDGAGHWVQQEQPGRVVELVKGFLKEVKRERISL